MQLLGAAVVAVGAVELLLVEALPARWLGACAWWPVQRTLRLAAPDTLPASLPAATHPSELGLSSDDLERLRAGAPVVRHERLRVGRGHTVVRLKAQLRAGELSISARCYPPLTALLWMLGAAVLSARAWLGWVVLLTLLWLFILGSMRQCRPRVARLSGELIDVCGLAAPPESEPEQFFNTPIGGLLLAVPTGAAAIALGALATFWVQSALPSALGIRAALVTLVGLGAAVMACACLGLLYQALTRRPAFLYRKLSAGCGAALIVWLLFRSVTHGVGWFDALIPCTPGLIWIVVVAVRPERERRALAPRWRGPTGNG